MAAHDGIGRTLAGNEAVTRDGNLIMGQGCAIVLLATATGGENDGTGRDFKINLGIYPSNGDGGGLGTCVGGGVEATGIGSASASFIGNIPLLAV